MEWVYNLRTPKGTFIEFRVFLATGRDCHPVMVADATLYAWPEQWNAQKEGLSKLSAKLEEFNPHTYDTTQRGVLTLITQCKDLASSLTARGLKGDWYEGYKAYENRRQFADNPNQ